MKSITELLTSLLSEAFSKSGYDYHYGNVVVSKTTFCQFQCNGALTAAKQYKCNPRVVADNVVRNVEKGQIIENISIEGSGFINIDITDTALVEICNSMSNTEKLGFENQCVYDIIVDYGGANIAKPLHVGHLRAAIIGECLKRLCFFCGHNVIGDVHLGDWGLQIGMIIYGLEKLRPDLPYFDLNYKGKYPKKSPITISELELLYPKISEESKNNKEVLNQVRQITVDLHNRRRGYIALWKKIREISVADLKKSYSALNVKFDLWNGESGTHDIMPKMIKDLQNNNHVEKSRNALTINVSTLSDNTEIPPLILVKSDGAFNYATTDLATIYDRVRKYNPQYIWYVVDKRQSLHFEQVFRAAYKTEIASSDLKLEHLGFGTMNGKDGKPFKTRAGGVMKLNDLVDTLVTEAQMKMSQVDISSEIKQKERNKIAMQVGIAALKFGDFINHPAKDYVFDIERFTSFEGKTGPYLLYSLVRIKSILRKANKEIEDYNIEVPLTDIERSLLLKTTEFSEIVSKAFHDRAPNYIADYLYNLASIFSSFYHKQHILNEKDLTKRESLLAILQLIEKVMTQLLYILGIEVPERM